MKAPNTIRSSRVEERSGVSLFELVVACGLLAALMAFLVPTLQRFTQVRSDLADRELAVVELRNLAERGMAGEDPTSLTLSSYALDLLNEPELAVESTQDADVPLQRIQMSLSWKNAVGQRVSPVTLSWWRSSVEGGE